MNLELEMIPTDCVTFYIRYQMYLRLAKMGSNSLPFRSPQHCCRLTVISE